MAALLVDHRSVRNFATSDERLMERGWRMVPLFTTHRDADTVTVSNHRVMLAMLERLDPEELGHGTMRAGHWAVGWMEHLLVDPARADLVAALESARDALEEYPLLSEDDHSHLESELHDDQACGDGCSLCEGEKLDHRRGDCGEDCRLCDQELANE